MKRGVQKLMKIGELARQHNLLPSTINYYTNEGLLPADARTRGGYRLYSGDKASRRLEQIRELQERRRLTIEEIKKIISPRGRSAVGGKRS
ncbi:MAG: MerR family transcriptional regulator [Candidatus Komeilibacteria bacterium]